MLEYIHIKKTNMKLPPSADIVHSYTPLEIQELYGKDAFYVFLDTNQFEIQSKKTTANNREVRYAYRELVTLWEPIIFGLSKNPKINLGQMIRNYQNPKNHQEQKNEIAKNLFHIAMSEYYDGKEITHEMIMLGLGMIFEDDLDWGNTESIVHLIGERVDEVFEEKRIHAK